LVLYPLRMNRQEEIAFTYDGGVGGVLRGWSRVVQKNQSEATGQAFIFIVALGGASLAHIHY